MWWAVVWTWELPASLSGSTDSPFRACSRISTQTGSSSLSSASLRGSSECVFVSPACCLRRTDSPEIPGWWMSHAEDQMRQTGSSQKKCTAHCVYSTPTLTQTLPVWNPSNPPPLSGPNSLILKALRLDPGKKKKKKKKREASSALLLWWPQIAWLTRLKNEISSSSGFPWFRDWLRLCGAKQHFYISSSYSLKPRDTWHQETSLILFGRESRPAVNSILTAWLKRILRR